MKKTKNFIKTIIFLTIITALTVFLFGCSSSGDSLSTGKKYSNYSANDAESIAGNTSGFDTVVTTTDRMMVYTVSLDLYVQDDMEAEKSIKTKLEEVGGYEETASVNDYSRYLTLRVPTEKLGEFIEQVKLGGKVSNYRLTGEDITEKYVTAQAKKKAYEDEYARLEQMLEAEDITFENRLTITNRMFELAQNIDSYTAKSDNYKKQADFSTVSIRIYKTENVPQQSFWDKLGEVLSGSTGSIGQVFGWIFIAIIAILPYALLVGVLFGLYVLIKFLVCRAKGQKFTLFLRLRIYRAKKREERDKLRKEYENKLSSHKHSKDKNAKSVASEIETEPETETEPATEKETETETKYNSSETENNKNKHETDEK